MAAAAVLAALAFFSPRAEAAGLRTKFGEVIVRNVKIGQVYSLNQVLNLPLRVLNTGEEQVELKIDVIRVAADQAKQGYEVVLDTGWVSLPNREFSVAPNHEAVTDVVIQLPNDKSLLGRKFEADIWTRTTGKGGMFGVGMQSRLLIQVSSEEPSAEELAAKYVTKKLANLDFTLLPMVGLAEDVPLGAEVDLKAARKVGIKLINPNEAALTFRVRALPNFEALLPVPAGYQEAPDPKWLKPAAEIVKVEGNSIKETALLLKVPDEARYRGQKLFFAVSVEVLEQEIPARVFYKLLVTTTK